MDVLWAPWRMAYIGAPKAEQGCILCAATSGDRRERLVLGTTVHSLVLLNRYPTANRSYGSPGPLRGMKLHVTEGGYRVPGIVRCPGHARPGTVAAEPVCGVDLLPTGNGFVVLELNGAVDFRPVYAPGRDVFSDAVAALLRDVARPRELAAAAGQ